MQISNIEERNRLYDAIASMGLVMSPSKAIAMARENCPLYETLPLKETDVNRIAYYGKHFMIHTKDQIGSEVWINGEYINDKRIEWVLRTNDEYHLYGIIDERYPFDNEIQFAHNSNILFRYSEYTGDTSTVKVYTTRIAEADVDGVDMYNACYYITQSKFYKPQITYENGYYTLTCPYISDIDLFCVGNMVYCGNVDANVGFVVDDVLSENVYTRIIVNNDDQYPVQTKFYPWLCVDKDCFIRVYSDTYMQIPYPLTCRLVNYEDFEDVWDPYNTDNEYLNSFTPSDEIIDPADTSDVIYEKFSSLVAEWYRCFESYPYYRYDSVFQLHTNTDEFSTEFKRGTLLLTGGEIKDVIVSTFPFDINRDVIFYEGKLLDDYSTAILHSIGTDAYELAPRGTDGYPVYVLDGSLDANKICVMKFTATGENTTVKNINYYLNKDNLLELYRKVNQFYRNLAFLQNVAFNVDELGEEVYVGAETPSQIDDRIWIELLSVADEDVAKALASRVPDSVTGLLPESLLEKMSTPLTAEEISTELHKLHIEQDLTIDDMEHHDIWIEWLNTVRDYVHFSKDNSIVMRLNEHLYLVEIEFDAETRDDVQILTFDDVVLNFREDQHGTRYLSILADLYKSGVVTENDITVFYDRLITSKDDCKPDLMRLKTYTGNVITKLARKKDDMCIVYSTNLGRVQLTPEHFVDADDREKLSQLVFSYKSVEDFAYLPGRVMIFVNGKLIPEKDLVESNPFEITFLDFDEEISTIDVLYNLIDVPLMNLRRLAMAIEPARTSPITTTSPSGQMEPIVMIGTTYKGFYDVLYHDYMCNDGMLNRLEYFADHPDEFDDFKKELLDIFSPITTRAGLNDYTGQNKIVLWGSVGAKKYTIDSTNSR